MSQLLANLGKFTTYLPKVEGPAGKYDPLTQTAARTGGWAERGLANNPNPPPAPPNPNDAANAARQLTDQQRLRRGLLATIYAGNTNTAPVSGKTALGT